ncbi:MAG TPA: methylenetetrahydrofolate reductase [Miltoncostaea sp.]|nr:methylenetetrahydrofolate reductase [Miltoncostaea sp.]
MRRIGDIIAEGPTLSIEFFPPRTDEAERQLQDALADLGPLGPSFASVTYGALGSTRDRTRDLVIGMNTDHAFPTMAHLTCVGHTRAEIARLLDEYAAAGVANILALGGDPPADGRPPDGDFTYAAELVEVVRAHPAGFSVGVAAHPELHPRSRSRAEDRRHLADKLALADFALTQFFFRAEDYARMLDELAALGCHRPVIPGVMPIISAAGVRRMAAMNHTRIPDELSARLDRVAHDPEAVAELGVETAAALCEELVALGVPGLHLYSLNRSWSLRRLWPPVESAVRG